MALFVFGALTSESLEQGTNILLSKVAETDSPPNSNYDEPQHAVDGVTTTGANVNRWGTSVAPGRLWIWPMQASKVNRLKLYCSDRGGVRWPVDFVAAIVGFYRP